MEWGLFAHRKFIMPKVLKAEYCDLQYLIDNIREEDREELKALGTTPEKSISSGFLLSDKVYSVLDDKNNTIAMYGVTKHTDETCVIWLLASNLINKHKMYFLRNCKGYFYKMVKNYKIAINSVYVKNTLHIKWLKWLGACFSRHFKYNNDFFISFKIQIKEK